MGFTPSEALRHRPAATALRRHRRRGAAVGRRHVVAAGMTWSLPVDTGAAGAYGDLKPQNGTTSLEGGRGRKHTRTHTHMFYTGVSLLPHPPRPLRRPGFQYQPQPQPQPQQPQRKQQPPEQGQKS